MGRFILLAHDLFRPAFARRSIEPNDKPLPGLRAGGKPVSTFRDHARAVCNACQIRNGVNGMSTCRTPCSASASSTAFIAHGRPPAQPASPQPLTPSGLVLVGTP